MPYDREQEFGMLTEVKQRKPKEELHICFMNQNMAWYKADRKKVMKMSKKGYTSKEIADELLRPLKEVEILLLEIRLNQHTTKRRKGDEQCYT